MNFDDIGSSIHRDKSHWGYTNESEIIYYILEKTSWQEICSSEARKQKTGITPGEVA